MRFVIGREVLLKPLQLITNVADRRHALPILANALLIIKGQELTLIGTDSEVEMQGFVSPEHVTAEGMITVPARKFMDIVRALPDQVQLEVYLEAPKLVIQSGRSRFSLLTLPAEEFPRSENIVKKVEFTIPATQLRTLLEETQFAMAQQDVRYYLNGMLWEVGDNILRAVATDGHRLAVSAVENLSQHFAQMIVPRKAVLEILRLLSDTHGEAQVIFSDNLLQVKTPEYVFTSKLIEGRFPDYNKLIPKESAKNIVLERDELKQALSRAAILANEKHKGIRLELRANLLRITANNPEQEEAQEELVVEYSAADLDIGFNADYLLDVLTVLPAGKVKLSFIDANSSVRLESVEKDKGIYIIMPMWL